MGGGGGAKTFIGKHKYGTITIKSKHSPGLIVGQDGVGGIKDGLDSVDSVVPHQLVANEPVGGPAGRRLLAGVELLQLAIVDSCKVFIDRVGKLPRPGLGVAGGLPLRSQAGGVLLLAPEDDSSDVAAVKAGNNWFGLVCCSRQNVGGFKNLLTGGHGRQNLAGHSSAENRQQSIVVHRLHHLEVVTLLLLAQRDVKDAGTPGAVALVHVVDAGLQVEDLLVPGHQLLFEVIILCRQPLD